MIVKNKYAVEFNDLSVRIFEAKDIEDLCNIIAEYFGFTTNLYDICMRGYKTCEENILVTNEFAKNHYFGNEAIINKIYLINTTLWEA